MEGQAKPGPMGSNIVYLLQDQTMMLSDAENNMMEKMKNDQKHERLLRADQNRQSSFVIVSSSSVSLERERSFPLQVYKLNWNILLSVSCSFVKVDVSVVCSLYSASVARVTILSQYA